MPLKYLSDLWDESHAKTLDPAALLRYRSNLLGSDLRITNFGGGNTSSKLEGTDPLDGQKKEVLWVKGSGGDPGQASRSRALPPCTWIRCLPYQRSTVGLSLKTRSSAYIRSAPSGNNPVAASIDTRPACFSSVPHVDHLHPDWGIALAASGKW